MSKIDQAVEIIKSSPSLERDMIIKKFMSDLGMSKAGATTYFYNARKKIGSHQPKERAHTAARKSASGAPTKRVRRPRKHPLEDQVCEVIGQNAVGGGKPLTPLAIAKKLKVKVSDVKKIYNPE